MPVVERVLAVDTEDTGLDLFHGARPYLITMCEPDGDPFFWEWPVDPETREPEVPAGDVREIQEALDGAETLVFHNAKYDHRALATVGIEVDWGKVEDTLVAGHLIASNKPHNLTDMVMRDLDVDIQPFEDRLEAATKEARRMVQLAKNQAKKVASRVPVKAPAGSTSRLVEFDLFDLKPLPDENVLASWRIAEEGLPEMPSYKSSNDPKKDPKWKYDCWLLRALAEHLGFQKPDPDCSHLLDDLRRGKASDAWGPNNVCWKCGGHRWWTLTSEYANADSFFTLKEWQWQQPEIERQGLWSYYRERVRSVPVLSRMEEHGATVNLGELHRLRGECAAKKDELSGKCVSIAKRFNYDLVMPKSGRNGSLNEFVFDVMKLEKVYDPKGKSAGPTLDAKLAIPHYLDTLEPGSDALEFIETLQNKRLYDPAVSYLDGYERYGLPLRGHAGWLLLHPSFHPTGTALLRRSSSNPNGQNVSSKSVANLRRCFGPAPGREWWTADGQNLELRIPGYESEQQELIDLFEKPNEPPFYGSEHLLNFSIVYPDFWTEAVKEAGTDGAGAWIKEHKPEWYKRCKNGDFAMGYGAMDRADGQGTADRSFGRPGSQAKLQARFAKKEALNQKYIRFAEKHGWVETIPDRELGCKRGYPLLVGRNEFGKIRPTEPLNYHVQGTAGWWMLKCLIRCDEQLTEWQVGGFDAWITLEVHDELVFDFPAGHGTEPWRTNLPKARRLQRLMESCGEAIGVPTPVSLKYCPKNWAEGKAV